MDNLGHTGPDGVQVTIISYNIYQTPKLLATHVVNLGHTGPGGLQVTFISYNIYPTLKLLVTHIVLTLVTLDQMVHKSQSSAIISYNIYQTLKLLVTHVKISKYVHKNAPFQH